MRVLQKLPGAQWRWIDVDNTLQDLQRCVGGYLESVTFASDCAILCDEEGRLKGLPENCVFLGVSFVGPILAVGVRGDRFCDLSFQQARILREQMQ